MVDYWIWFTVCLPESAFRHQRRLWWDFDAHSSDMNAALQFSWVFFLTVLQHGSIFLLGLEPMDHLHACELAIECVCFWALSHLFSVLSFIGKHWYDAVESVSQLYWTLELYLGLQYGGKVL